MKKTVLMALLLAAVLASPAPAAEKTAMNGDTLLNISATAAAKVTPDIAEISAGVVTQEPVAAKALAQNTEKMNALFKALKAAGVAEKDIQTSNFSVTPQYNYTNNNPTPALKGYRVEDMVNARLYDLKNIGAVLDALVKAGSNQIDGPAFSVENPDDALDGARRRAVEKAVKRAEVYAAAAGLRVKRIVSISEQNNNPMPRPMMMRAMAMNTAAPTPVATGEENLGITLNVQFELSRN